MKRTYKALFLAAVLTFTIVPALNPVADTTVTAEAHGCHSSRSHRSSGHYHCNGHEAHFHENGICPYYADDKCTDDAAPCYESCEQNHDRGHC